MNNFCVKCEEILKGRYCDNCGYCVDSSSFKNIVAILSTTILPLDGTYSVKTSSEVPDIVGILHYIGHPSTKEIVENLGAVKADTNLFQGLGIGESALAFSIKQGQSSRKTEGFTVHQDTSLDILDCRIITRID